MIKETCCIDALARLEIEEAGLSKGYSDTKHDHIDAERAKNVIEAEVKAAEAAPIIDREALSALRTTQMDYRQQADELYRVQRQRLERLDAVHNEQASWSHRLSEIRSPEGQGV